MSGPGWGLQNSLVVTWVVVWRWERWVRLECLSITWSLQELSWPVPKQSSKDTCSSFSVGCFWASPSNAQELLIHSSAFSNLSRWLRGPNGVPEIEPRLIPYKAGSLAAVLFLQPQKPGILSPVSHLCGSHSGGSLPLLFPLECFCSPPPISYCCQSAQNLITLILEGLQTASEGTCPRYIINTHYEKPHGCSRERESENP